MSSVDYARFVRHTLTPEEVLELSQVDRLAGQLTRHLDASRELISSVHVHAAQSKDVQAIVGQLLVDRLGFGQEIVITPEIGFVTRARPDFFLSLSPGRGVIAEVERGGTTNNNHDLKDFGKAHVALDVQHLFLIVPLANWTLTGSARERPFRRVCRRLQAFFGDARREVDVLSLHVFGYGAAGVELTLDGA